MCSTPSGVTEFDTPRPAGAASSSPCAQRLPASLNSTLGLDLVHPVGVECSTPSGVTEFDTTAVRPRTSRPSGAQRLPASLNSTRCLSPCISDASPCAQRLPASLNSTPQAAGCYPIVGIEC